MPVQVTEFYTAYEWTPGESCHREFYVSGIDDEWAVLSARDGTLTIPQEGEAVAHDSDLTWGTPKITRETPVNDWKVVCDATSIVLQPGESPAGTGRIMLQYQFHFGAASEPRYYDVDQNPLLNSAGDPVDPPPSTEHQSLFIDVIRVESYYNLELAVEYQNTVNEDTVSFPGLGKIQPGQVKFVGYIPAQPIWMTAKNFDTVMSFEVNRLGFDPYGLDMGLRGWRYKYGAEFNRVLGSFRDARGDKITTPIRLNGQGMPLDNSAGVTVDGATPVACPKQFPWMNYQTFIGPNAVFGRPKMKTRKPFGPLKVFF